MYRISNNKHYQLMQKILLLIVKKQKQTENKHLSESNEKKTPKMSYRQNIVKIESIGSDLTKPMQNILKEKYVVLYLF